VQIRFGSITDETTWKIILSSLVILIPERYHQLVGLSKNESHQLEIGIGLETYLFLKEFPTKRNKKVRKNARRL
jgi:hypothetical protein